MPKTYKYGSCTFKLFIFIRLLTEHIKYFLYKKIFLRFIYHKKYICIEKCNYYGLQKIYIGNKYYILIDVLHSVKK